MKDPKIKNETTVIFGPVRLCYTHLLERYKFDGDAGEGKYSTNILIPKKEKKTIEAINGAIEAAIARGITAKWGGRKPKKLADSPLRDGDEREDEAFQNHYFLNAKSSRRPSVTDRSGDPITDAEEVYSGMWGYVSVSFFPYSTGGNNGVGCSINAVRKFKDDDRLGGGGDSSRDFDGFDDDEDDI